MTFPAAPKISQEARDFIRKCLTFDKDLRPTVEQLWLDDLYLKGHSKANAKDGESRKAGAPQVAREPRNKERASGGPNPKQAQPAPAGPPQFPFDVKATTGDVGSEGRLNLGKLQDVKALSMTFPPA